VPESRPEAFVRRSVPEGLPRLALEAQRVEVSPFEASGACSRRQAVAVRRAQGLAGLAREQAS